MAIEQKIWSLDEKEELKNSKLLSERELEDFICENINVLNEDWIIIGRQIQTGSGGILDILCLDRDGDTIVIELKRDSTPREVTAQAIDYAACVCGYKAEKLAELFKDFTDDRDGTLKEVYKEKFKVELNEEEINQEVKMVIVASEMDASTERIINYLSTFSININILFFTIFEHAGKRLLSRAWLHEYDSTPFTGPKITRAWNQEYYASYGVDTQRTWEDARKYGFVSAGGGNWYTKTLKMLSKGDRVWVYLPQQGYVGAGIVTEEAMPASHALIKGKEFFSLGLSGGYMKEDDNPDNEEWIVPLEWIHTVEEKQAVREYGFFGNQNTVCRPTTEKWDFTIKFLKDKWKIDEKDNC